MEDKDYIYDVFLSYRRRPPVGDWVKYHFYPLLVKWLPQCMPHEPRVFIDLNVDTGAQWPLSLSHAIQHSRCLLSVWSPDYFRSDWCLAEWHSMQKRENLLGFGNLHNRSGLIYPVVYSDGQHFPNEAKNTQSRDLRLWNCSYPYFSETKGIVELEREVQIVTEELWGMIQQAPAWQGDFPLVTPSFNASVTVKLPRLE
jgi:hypothetical protein